MQEPDLAWGLLDSTVVRARAQAAGSRKKSGRGRSPWPEPRRAEHQNSRPGRRARQPLAGALGGGQQADCRRAADLLAAAQGTGNVLAYKGYNTDAVLARVAALGAKFVLPSKKNCLVQRLIDRNVHCDRNKVERFFGRLKQVRRLATRYDKTASSFLGMVHFISAIRWLP